MRFARVFVLIAGVIFGLLGVWYGIDPTAAAAANVTATSPTGFSDIRAVYGGVSLGLGAAFLIAGVQKRDLRPAAALAALVCLGLGGFRTLGIVLDGFTPFSAGFAAFELTGAVFGALAWRKVVAAGG